MIKPSTLTARVLPYLEGIEALHKAGFKWPEIYLFLTEAGVELGTSSESLRKAALRAREGVEKRRLWVEQKPLPLPGGQKAFNSHKTSAKSTAASGVTARPEPFDFESINVIHRNS
ncbi:hypothetical protein ACSSZE_15035 [Acidithiobacillus caldus]|jgi:hypothetical protein